MERLKRHEASVTGVIGSVIGERWAELTMHEKLQLDSAQLRKIAEAIRALTENPVTARSSDQPVVPEFLRLVSGAETVPLPGGESEVVEETDAVGVSHANGGVANGKTHERAAADQGVRRRKKSR
jgi:hypothetical protein